MGMFKVFAENSFTHIIAFHHALIKRRSFHFTLCALLYLSFWFV